MSSFSREQAERSKLFPMVAALFVLLIVPKLVFAFFLLLEDIYRLLRSLVVFSQYLITKDNSVPYFESRRKFFSTIGSIIASIPFLAILHGITKGKYNFKIHRVTLSFKDLPEEFHGFTITQLSDIHAGSLDNEEEVKTGIEIANAQKSDMLVFTGDLVNNKAEEMDKWAEAFKQIKAPYGKYSILGNHDYGDYIIWPSAREKAINFKRLKEIHAELGFRLLLNESISLKKINSSISLLGVENWGYPPFPQHGDLNKALGKVKDDDFKILLSHDPSHFEGEVIKHNKHIHLTLSGHTHGMQFGIEIGNVKWSPVKYRYPRWAGLYEEAGKYLYVNRGFGFLAFPGRVGIWPEITVITLKKA